MARCRRDSENRKPGSSGIPGTAASGAVSIASSSSASSKNQSTSFWKISATIETSRSDGTRLPFSIIDR